MAGGLSGTASTNVSGLSSGIDWNSLIDAQIKADGASAQLLQNRSDLFQKRLDSVRSLNTKLLSLKLDLNSLRSSTQNNIRSATSSSAALSVSATSNATPASYVVDVVSMAKAHQMATEGQSSNSATIGADTIHLQLGTGATTDIAISADDSSLDGIARTLNAASLGVTATVVNDGTVGSPYRLMLTSNSTGLANEIHISADGALQNLFAQADPLQAASNAKIRLGGASGLLIEQPTNTFSNVISGVTFTVNQETASGVAVTVGTNTDGAKTAIKQVVTSLNAVATFMKENANYDLTSQKAGVLFSETDVKNGYNELINAVMGTVPGLPNTLSTFDAIGIVYDAKSRLFQLDETVLNSKLASDPAGVVKLFSNSGTSTDAGIQFGSMTDKTKANKTFAVVISQAAKKAVVNGAVAITAPVVIDGTNRDLALKVNGKDYAVQLTAGTYNTVDDLAKHLQSILDQKITTPGERVTVGQVGGALRLTSAGYGLSNTLEVDVASTANSVLQLATNKSYGADVTGTIDGVAAEGNGQVLSGVAGSDSDGLRLLVSATAPVASASVTAVQGLAQAVSQSVSRLTDSATGSLVTKQDSLQTSIDALKKSVDANNTRLEIRRERYRMMYQNMEKLINQANSTSSYLTGQIKSWQASAANA